MPPPLNRLLDELHSTNRLRASSLIITFFGDSIVPRGGVVSAATIQTVMKRCRISDGATRTALSRLARDSWLIRDRQGRLSHYRLSAQGHEPFAAASRRIYAKPGEMTACRTFLLAMPLPHVTPPLPGISFAQNLRLVTKEEIEGHEDMWLSIPLAGAHIPSHFKTTFLPAGLSDACQIFLERFDGMKADSPLDALAARTLLIHEWRRLLLRTPEAPDFLFPANWTGPACHRLTLHTYDILKDGAELWLDTNGRGPQGTLPAASKGGSRF